VELSDHEGDWLKLWVELWPILLPFDVADDPELLLCETFDHFLLLTSDLVPLGDELEVSIAELELMRPAKS
jgi:hypothetical protein